nr:hypothetical protein [uncultured Flavobacterium sp.]
MAYSKIKIKFLEVPVEGTMISFTETLSGTVFTETFKPVRAAAKETELPVLNAETGIYTGFVSEKYYDALQQDYNAPFAYYSISRVNGIAGSGIGSLELSYNYAGSGFVLNTNTAAALIAITNIDPINPIVNSVTPGAFTFDVNKYSVSSKYQQIEISTAGNWNVVGDLPDWLSLSELSGNGNEISIVNIKNYSSLDPEQYIYDLVYNLGGEEFTVPVVVNVSNVVNNPFSIGKLYFTKELIYLNFTSVNLNSYIHFDVEIKTFKINSNEETVYNRSYSFPLFKGKGDFHVGEIVEGLLDDIESLEDYVTSFKTNYFKKQIRPAEILISFQEKEYLTNEVLTFGDIGLIKMIKGYRPFTTSGQMALLTVSQQEITRITPDSIVGTSFVYIGKPRIIVKLNNNIIEDFEIDESANEIIYSYYRFNNNFKPGDSIEILIVNGLEVRSQRFLVFRRGLESTYLFFENQNGMIEPYEFSGRRRINSTFKHTTTTKIKNRSKYDKKVLSDNQQGMILNTGQLLKTDQRIITAIISSLNVWCSIDDASGPYFLIDAVTTKLLNQDTDSAEEGFDIEFNILEDSNASIYPR